MKDPKKIAMGKKSRAQGQRFELAVRKDLEKKGWICDKWGNNVELEINGEKIEVPDKQLGLAYKQYGKLIPAKRKWAGPNRPMMLSSGFPDFIAFKYSGIKNQRPPTMTFHNFKGDIEVIPYSYVSIIGVESKMTGVLDKKEKAKCEWLLDNHKFSKILIAKKGTKRGEIEYVDFSMKYSQKD